MIILEDSRQQESKHKIKHEWFLKNNVQWNRSALVCGDYQLPGNGSIAVDTKKDIQELIGDIQFKAMSKRDISDKLMAFSLSNQQTTDLYHLITDDDTERFVENEISEYCFKHGISEGILKEVQQLYVKRHGFFHRGLLRAKNYGVQLYILVDNTDGVEDYDSLFRWVNPRRRIMINSEEQIGYYKNGNPRYKKIQKYPNCMMGEQLAKACLTMEKKYGCKFLFCKPQEAGEMIIQILTS